MCAPFEGSEEYFFGSVVALNAKTGTYHIDFADGDVDEFVKGVCVCVCMSV